MVKYLKRRNSKKNNCRRYNFKYSQCGGDKKTFNVNYIFRFSKYTIQRILINWQYLLK